MMGSKYKRIFICCHGGTVTGGPEAAHQLVDLLRALGAQAYVSYIPFDRLFETAEAFRSYNAPVAKPLDERGDMVVLPETAAYLARNFGSASVAIWWLSVDAFFGLSGLWPGRNRIERKFVQFVGRYRRRLLRSESNTLRGLQHFVQSRYAADFLERNNLPCLPLGDYVNLDFAATLPTTVRHDAIAYSRKGLKTATRLMRRYPKMKWISIEGLSRTQVRALLCSVKLYVDFGGHPGKDRLPREAALCGACVITGRQGSARFAEDIPIAETYKLDDTIADFEQKFYLLVKDIFATFDQHQVLFDPYRTHIHNEKARLIQEIETAFFENKHPTLSVSISRPEF